MAGTSLVYIRCGKLLAESGPGHLLVATQQSAGKASRAEVVLETLSLARSIGWTKASKQDENREEDQAEDDQLPCNGLGRAEFTPGASSLADMLLDLIGAELVVQQTTKSNAVAEELGHGYLRAPDHHRACDQQNIFEDTAEGEDERGRLADLVHVNLCAFIVQNKLTKKTTETLRRNATMALLINMNKPTS